MNALTAKEIFQNISELQNQLNDSYYSSMVQFASAINAVVGDGEERDEDSLDKMPEVCEVFKAREMTFVKLLGLYEKMYDDVQNERFSKVDIISRAFEKNSAYISESDLEEKCEALNHITDRIAELVSQLIANKEV